jgi:DNA repair ATPase RecN
MPMMIFYYSEICTGTGRNVCRVNGQLVNTTTLKEIGETIVDIHGQNEHQELMHPEKHLALLDEFYKAKGQSATCQVCTSL